MGIAPLLALALLATRIEGGASASASSDVGTPTAQTDTASIEPGLFLAGTLSLSIQDPLEGVSIAYSPRFTLGGGEAAQLFHQLSLTGSWKATASQSFQLGEALAYGDQDFSPLAPGNAGMSVVPPPIDRLPADEVLRMLTSTSTLGSTTIISPFLKLTSTASFSIGGGLGSEARAQLPLQRTGSLSSSLGWSLSKIDQLSASAIASLSYPDSNDSAQTISALMGWTHVVSAATSTAVQLGAAYIHDAGPNNEQQGAPLTPTGSASISHHELLSGTPYSLAASVGAAPAIDPLTGAAYLRGTLTGSATWSVSQTLALSVSVSGAHGLGPDLQHDWGAEASVSASLKIPPSTSVSLGFRSAWLSPEEVTGLSSSYIWSAFASVAWGDTHSF